MKCMMVDLTIELVAAVIYNETVISEKLHCPHWLLTSELQSDQNDGYAECEPRTDLTSLATFAL